MKQLLRVTAMLSVLFFSFEMVKAQTRLVMGTVQDDQGKPLPAVAVQVKGTTIGTYTDMEGKFSLAVPSDAKIISVHFAGKKSQEVTISDNMVVTLTTDALGLDEVVVTALGISKEKKSISYATQTVGSEQLNNSGTGNALSELNGKVAGLTVINSSGDPGAGTYFRMRGVTSLTGNNQPLMVVDGIPIDNSINAFDAVYGQGLAAGNANGNYLGGPTSTNRGLDINPDDIESVTVLKGPAATALYGIQAASGAVIITTKKGNGSKHGVSVSFNSSTSADKVNKLPSLQNQYAQGENGIWVGADGTYGDGTSAGANAGFRKYSWGPAIDTMRYATSSPGFSNYDSHGRLVSKNSPLAGAAVTPYNPYDFFQTGMTTNNNIALSGGTDRSGFRMSIGNLYQTGVIPQSSYNKSTVSINGQSALTKRLSVSGGMTYVKSDNAKPQNGSSTSGVMLGLTRTPPTFDNANGNKGGKTAANDSTSYVLPDGTQRDYRGGAGYDNPYWTVNRNPYTSNVDRMFGYAQVSYHLLSWMDLGYRLGGDVYGQSDKSAYDIGSNGVAGGTGAIYLIDYFNRQYNSDFTINMQKKFSDDLSGSLLLGQNYFSLTNRDRVIQGTTLNLPDFLDISNATSVIAGEGESMKRTSAWYGEGQLSYKSMLFLTVTGREETSSTLPAAHNTFFYPSASLGWVFTEPLKMSTNKILPYGKLRFSFAQVGKDAPVEGTKTYFAPVTFNDGYTSGISFPFDGIPGYQISSAVTTIGNPDLKPENTFSYEGGFDLAFFKNRISLNATFYYSDTKDAIFTVPISYASGFGAELLNAAELTNKGAEITLNTTPIKTKWGLKWDLNFNWSRNVNKVVQLAPGVNNLLIAGFTAGGVYAVKGYSFGEIFGTDYVRDGSGNILINDDKTSAGYGMPQVGSNNVALGNVNPDWIGSAINNLSYKGITLGFQLDVRHGGIMWDGTRGALDFLGTAAETSNRGTSTTFSGVLGHLNAAGQVVHYASDGVTEIAGAGGTNNVSAMYGQYYWQNLGGFNGPTIANIENSGYVRFRQISLTYDFSKKLVAKMHLIKLSLTAFANNPLLWTKYKGVDPETSLTGPSNGQGLDYFNNPSIKSYGLKLNVGL